MSDPPAGNLFGDALPDPAAERVMEILHAAGARIERIVSTGQSSPAGFWYDQPLGEWVLLVQGAASLRFEDEAQDRRLVPGDYLWIAPRRRHRVEWTQSQPVTIWLAVHIS